MAVAWLAVARSALSPAWALVPAIAFGGLLVVHARVLNRAERAQRAHRLYQRGLARLEGRWAGTGMDGSRFLDDHPYARDLDLFGRGSLFELINTARTEAGEETLAAWLKSGAAIDEVRARQAACRRAERPARLPRGPRRPGRRGHGQPHGRRRPVGRIPAGRHRPHRPAALRHLRRRSCCTRCSGVPRRCSLVAGSRMAPGRSRARAGGRAAELSS